MLILTYTIAGMAEQTSRPKNKIADSVENLGYGKRFEAVHVSRPPHHFSLSSDGEQV
jgi:hypothetical protein